MGNLSPRDRALQKIREAKEKQLEELDLSNDGNTPDEDKLTEIPEEVFELKHLKILKLSNHRISHLSESLGNFTILKKLHLNGNQLTNLPEFLGNLTSLNELYLNGNQLKTLPESIGNLASLNKFYLSGNPLEKPPLDVAVKGIEEIKEYFEQLRKDGQDYIYEAKLLIVGEGGAGKTTLAKKIQNPKYKLQDEDSTKGIDVIKWRFKCLD